MITNLLDKAHDLLACAILWVTPASVHVTHPAIGRVTFKTRWFGHSTTTILYFTPLGEIPNVIDLPTATAIVNHCKDWVDALVLVDHAQNGCDCQ